MSMAVWNGFMESFPTSQTRFGMTFQTIICDCLAEWMRGIVPVNPWCLKWESVKPISVLKPQKKQQITNPTKISLNQGTFDFLSLRI